MSPVTGAGAYREGVDSPSPSPRLDGARSRELIGPRARSEVSVAIARDYAPGGHKGQTGVRPGLGTSCPFERAGPGTGGEVGQGLIVLPSGIPLPAR